MKEYKDLSANSVCHRQTAQMCTLVMVYACRKKAKTIAASGFKVKLKNFNSVTGSADFFGVNVFTAYTCKERRNAADDQGFLDSGSVCTQDPKWKG